MIMRIHPATLEELRQEAAEAQEALGALNPSSYAAQRVIAGLQRLRQEIQEVERATSSLASTQLAA